MPSRTLSRKARFKAALAYAGMTKTQWCAERTPKPVTTTHLNEVLDGRRVSAPLVSEVDAFIAAHTPRAVRAA